MKITRLQHGISLDELEIRTRIPKKTIQSWEHGTDQPRGLQFIRWVEAFENEVFLEASLLMSDLMKY